ncbi:unnamed protein product [Natator depressus]
MPLWGVQGNGPSLGWGAWDAPVGECRGLAPPGSRGRDTPPEACLPLPPLSARPEQRGEATRTRLTAAPALSQPANQGLRSRSQSDAGSLLSVVPALQQVLH